MENMENIMRIAAQAVIVLADNSDDSDGGDDEQNDQLYLNVDWWRRLGDPTFRKHFRMDRWVFESLLLTVGRHLDQTNRLRGRSFPLDISLMITLWTLATPDSFRSIGTTFGKAQGSVHRQYVNMIGVISELRGSYVSWPSGFERNRIARQLEARFGYPDVLGCIDGSHICITAPLEQPQRYFNYHHDYSLILQAVCDHRLLFRDVFVGQPGAVGDRRTFERSALGRAIHDDPQIMGHFHLLGDGAFMLTDKLLIPYRNYGNLTQQQRFHNYILSRCRSCIERAFALLKGKWRRLKAFPSLCLEYCVDHIMACIVLHNFIILEGEAYEMEYVMNEVPDDGHHVERLAEAQANGILKREYIAAMLMNPVVEADEEAEDDPDDPDF